MIKLNKETYKKFDIEFEEKFDNSNERFVELQIKDNGKLIIGTSVKTKSQGLDWAKDYIDKNYKQDLEDDWKVIAKKELEKELDVKTKILSYSNSYNELNLESISGTGNNGESEWLVIKDMDIAETIAIEKVREDIIDSPEMFSQDFIENHIDIKNLDSQLEEDAYESSRSYYDDIASETDSTYGSRQIQELIENGNLEERTSWNDKDDTQEKYENAPDYNKSVEDSVEDMSNDKMSNGGIEYLKEIYSDEEAIKKAIEIGGIDEYSASEEAVDIDGVAHFLDGYDGSEVELKSGAVAFGTN